MSLSPDADPFDFVFTSTGEPIARLVDELAEWARHPIEQGWRSFTFMPRLAVPPTITRGAVKAPVKLVFYVETLTRHKDGAKRPMVRFANDADVARYLEIFPDAAVSLRPAP